MTSRYAALSRAELAILVPGAVPLWVAAVSTFSGD
jgi:hypothetical protein